MMSTCCSKHVEEWSKYIKKECVKLVINQNYVKMHGQQNIKHHIIYEGIKKITWATNYKMINYGHCYKN
jgi:deoxycytidylate deaminase